MRPLLVLDVAILAAVTLFSIASFSHIVQAWFMRTDLDVHMRWVKKTESFAGFIKMCPSTVSLCDLVARHCHCRRLRMAPAVNIECALQWYCVFR